LSKRLVIVGSGRCVWDDLEKLYPITADVMCINDMIPFYPGDIHHICSFDGPMLAKWWDARRPPYKKMFPMIPRWHTADNGMPVGRKAEVWEFKGGGTSGLLACVVGLNIGYENIVLCGVPIDNSGHFWEAPPGIWEAPIGRTNFQREVTRRNGTLKARGDNRRFWGNAADNIFEGRIKSMSGFTKELLGSP